MTLCTTCRKANVSCPIYPQDTMSCVEYAPTESAKPKIYHFDPSEERGYYICSEGYKCTVGKFVALTEYRELQAENAELRADAERYRWLREQHWTDNTMAAVRWPKEAVKLGHDCPSGDRLDEEIDALRQRAEQDQQDGRGA